MDDAAIQMSLTVFQWFLALNILVFNLCILPSTRLERRHVQEANSQTHCRAGKMRVEDTTFISLLFSFLPACLFRLHGVFLA